MDVRNAMINIKYLDMSSVADACGKLTSRTKAQFKVGLSILKVQITISKSIKWLIITWKKNDFYH